VAVAAAAALVFAGFISIAIDDALCLEAGSFNRNTPCMLVGFFSHQFPYAL
jgi:hypothetical protein